MKLKDSQYEQNYVQQQCYQKTLRHIQKVANHIPVHIKSFKKPARLRYQYRNKFISSPAQNNLRCFRV